MKIAEIRIKNYMQFRDIKLDFTDNEGKPVNKICFIGKNGTGKSTLLRILNSIINRIANFNSISNVKCYIKIYINNKFLIVHSSKKFKHTFYFTPEIETENNWFENLLSLDINEILGKYLKYVIKDDEFNNLYQSDIQLKDNSKDLLIYSPAESSQNSYLEINDVPNTNLNAALEYFKSFPISHTVSDENVQEFWRLLIFLIKKRENERETFENKSENLEKTKKQLIEEFNKKHPKILDKLAKLWNKILDHAGLEFDIENANKPIQLTDNLKAYIRLKSTKQRINYNQLSTGIRNFIFRVGHIYSLYFNREIKKGFLLLDEPENSLFPDFLFDLIETYQEIVIDKNNENNTQFFVSTHNPIVAAQFEPYERIILEWNEDGFVDAYKGSAPAGDDPNDVLHKDFKLKHLMGKKGREMWEYYIDLRKQLAYSTEKKEKMKLISEINRIGELYNFEN